MYNGVISLPSYVLIQQTLSDTENANHQAQAYHKTEWKPL